MREDLQKRDYRASPYVRPNQAWVCGWAAEGTPCHIGPDIKGRCQATFECRPVKMKGDRWQCTRSELAGGKCETGPLPDGTCCRPIPRCQPVRSIRARRGLTARWAVAVTIGIVLVFLGGSAGHRLVNPGPLTFQHVGVSTCAGCHSAFDGGMTAWVHAAFAEANELRDSARCLACHNLGMNGLAAHGLPSVRVAALTDKAAQRSNGASAPLAMAASRSLFGSRGEGGADLPCMTCHKEHHGQDFDLTTMSNPRCLSCHSTAFASLSDGHPEFTGYPYERRARIRFDHASHIGKHFRDTAVKDNAPGECKDCHTPDLNGRTMIVAGFEKTCAACHAGQIEGEGRATAKGLAVFNVPGLDVATLSERDAAIGVWPEDPDGEITPFMDFLLSPEDDYSQAKAKLADLDLLDLSEASDDEIAAIERFAWSIKGLYFDLTTEGVTALQERFEAALGRNLGSGEMARLAGLLPADAMGTAQAAWFPGLLGEVPRHRDGEAISIPDADDAEEEDDEKSADEADDEEADDEGDIIGEDDEDDDAIGEDDEDDDAIGEDDDEDADEEDAEDDDAEEAAEVAAGEDWSAAGGWYREDFAIRYRPTGHEDAFLREWLNATGLTAARTDTASAAQIFEHLAQPGSPGLCAKCHSVDARADGVFTVNWLGARPVPNHQKFTQFSHTAHFSLLDQRGCLNCHQVDSKANFLDGFKNRDPATFASNFKPLDRQVCAGCHTEAEAGDSCILCHNYHIGDIAPPVARTPPISEAMPK